MSAPKMPPRIQISLKQDARSNLVESSPSNTASAGGKSSIDVKGMNSITTPARLPSSTTIPSSGTTTNSNWTSPPATTTKASTAATASAVAGTPVLTKKVRKALKRKTLNFKINVECTSLRLSPSGNFLWGGFSDGTLRVFDLTGTFGLNHEDPMRVINGGSSRPVAGTSISMSVNSKLSQLYGAVACQIHARGVHTDLLTTVDISPDGKYVFCGVQRGATELYAVHVEELEAKVATASRKEHPDVINPGVKELAGSSPMHEDRRDNILDFIHVYCHSDAKLKGFGACTDLRSSKSSNSDDPTSYLLLTGKGIKNIHIWKFTPPPVHIALETTNAESGNNLHQNDRTTSNNDGTDATGSTNSNNEDDGIWEQLYDTQTNGNTIHLLDFYRNPQGKLMAISKSDVQKLRLWDLSFEEQQVSSTRPGIVTGSATRPKRPPYQDVANSHAAVGVAGRFCVCGGDSMYNQLSIVSLDQPKNQYNHTELALPSGTSGEGGSVNVGDVGGSSSSRRQRRGEMKAVVSVAAPPHDSSHALLELDDGSLVQYSADLKGCHKLPTLSLATPESTGIPSLPAEFWNRSLCLANVGGVIIAASCLYNPNSSRGQIVIRALHGLTKLKVSNPKGIKNSPNSTESTPLPIKQSNQLLESPIADSVALRDAVLAPPPSEPRANSKSKEPGATTTSAGGLDYFPQLPASQKTKVQNDATTLDGKKVHPTKKSSIAPSSVPEVSFTVARLTPDTAPFNQTNEDVSTTISKHIEPKRIMQQQTKPKETPRPSKVEIVSTITVGQKKRKVTSTSPRGETSSRAPCPNPARNSDESADSIKPKQRLDNNGLSKKEAKVIKKARREESLMKRDVMTQRVVTPKNVSIVPSSVTPNDNVRVLPTISENESTPPTTVNAGFPSSEKRERPISTLPRESSVMSDSDTALVLASLKSTAPRTRTDEDSRERIVANKARESTPDSALKPVLTTPKVAKTVQPVHDAVSVTPLPAPTPKKTVTPSATAKPSGHLSNIKSPLQSNREELLRERASIQYKQLQVFLKNVTEQSMLLIRSRHLQKPSTAQNGNARQEHPYDKLMFEHRASHILLQKQLLRSAETTLRLLMESSISLDEARVELKDTIKEYEGILYDTLQRQEMERLSLVACHSMKDHPSDSTEMYPCQSAFRKVDDICTAISRPVGRPKSGQPSSKP